MTRTLGIGVVLLAAALAWLAAPTIGLDVETSLSVDDESASGGVSAETPVLSDLVGLNPVLDLSKVVPGLPLSEPASEPEPAQADEAESSAPHGFQLPPEAQRTTAAIGVGAAVALLVGLLVHSAGGFMPLFSRIRSNHMLDNEVRHRVHEAVSNNPGITIKEVTNVCSIGWGTAVYHLKRLEAERLIVSERNRQYRRYFKNGGGIVNDSKTAYSELKNPTGKRIATTILVAPGSCQKELCERVGISAPLAHKYLARLQEAGLVAIQREWKTVRYYPTSQLEALLAPVAPSLPPPMALPAAPAASAPLVAAA